MNTKEFIKVYKDSVDGAQVSDILGVTTKYVWKRAHALRAEGVKLQHKKAKVSKPA